MRCIYKGDLRPIHSSTNLSLGRENTVETFEVAKWRNMCNRPTDGRPMDDKLPAFLIGH